MRCNRQKCEAFWSLTLSHGDIILNESFLNLKKRRKHFKLSEVFWNITVCWSLQVQLNKKINYSLLDWKLRCCVLLIFVVGWFSRYVSLFQKERDTLLVEMETLVSLTDEQAQKMKETYVQKLKMLESQVYFLACSLFVHLIQYTNSDSQIAELKRSQESQTQLLRQKQRSDEAAKRLQEEIQRMKAQRVFVMWFNDCSLCLLD